MNRHARQIILPQVGKAGQARLKAAHVLIVGAGGLGVPVLQYLAGAGIGRITLIDPDVAEQTNLHRQPIYAAHLGQPKALAAAKIVAALDPAVQIEVQVAALSPTNASAFISSTDVVLDCADSFAASYTLSDCCLELGKPLISASALGLSGYVGGFCGGAPSLRAVFPDLPQQTATCASAGVLGPVVGMLGTIQAQMALACILGLEPSPLGQLLRFDMNGWRFSSFRFDNAPEPDSHYPFIAPESITATDLVIELRDEAEAPIPAHPRALRILPDDLSTHPLPDAARVVFACQSGLRAWRAADAVSTRFTGPIALMAAATLNPRTDT